MLYILRNGNLTGVKYPQDTPHIRNHHEGQGDTCLWLDEDISLEMDEDDNCTTQLTFNQLKTAKRNEIARQRWLAETGGITVGGSEIDTSRESQSLLAGAAMKAKEDSSYTVNWKGKNGWFTLTASEIISISDAVRNHVQSCFDQEMSLSTQIDAATTEAELDAVVWS